MEPDAFDSQVIEPLDLRVVGSKVLVRARTKIGGAGSGIEAEFLFWAVWTFDEAGVPTRVEIYLDHQEAEALEAAGLSDVGAVCALTDCAGWRKIGPDPQVRRATWQRLWRASRFSVVPKTFSRT